MNRSHYTVRELVKDYSLPEHVVRSAIASGELPARRVRIRGREHTFVSAQAWEAWATGSPDDASFEHLTDRLRRTGGARSFTRPASPSRGGRRPGGADRGATLDGEPLRPCRALLRWRGQHPPPTTGPHTADPSSATERSMTSTIPGTETTTTSTAHGGRDWRDRAACRGLDTELFFPIEDSAPALADQIHTAKAVCARCPVRQRCLDEALRLMPYGIAGGLTASERRRLHPGVRTEPEAPLRQRTSGATRSENRRVGLKALRAGHGIDEVAAHCRVARRTVERWAADVRTQPASHKAEGSAAATAAPLLSRSNALAGTRITEGNRF